MSYQEWLDKLGTAKLSGIAFSIFVRSRESGGKLDVDQAWFDRYVKWCRKHDVEPSSTVEDVGRINDSLADEDDG